MVIRAGLNPFSSSPQRCRMDLRSGLCAGYSQGFPQLSGRTIALWGWLCAQGHYHVEKETFFSLNCCHKRGSSVFFTRRCDSWELRCYLPLLSVLHHHLSHTEIQSWTHLSTKLAQHCPVSSLLRGLLPHTAALVSSHAKQIRLKELARGQQAVQTPSQTSNVNKVC